MSSFASGARKPYSRPGRSEGVWRHDMNQNAASEGPAGRRGHHQNQRGGLGVNNGGGSAVPAGASTGVSSKLKISNLHYEVTPKDLNSIFGQIGTLVREPHLWYDESGRSTGNALVSFETAAEATRAKNQYDGILAKGQPMNITYFNPPRAPRRAVSAPSTSSLLARIEKPPLLERLARDDSATAVNETRNARREGNIGPIRGRRGAQRGEPKVKAARQPKKPKTAEDLDKELDAFMGDANPETAAPAEASGQDVAMTTA